MAKTSKPKNGSRSPNVLSHRGYSAAVQYDAVQYDADDGLLWGVVDGIRDVVHFEAGSPDEVRAAFEGSVDAYLEQCEHDGVEPNLPKSGTFNVRATPEIHRLAEQAARAAGVSLNEWAVDRIARDEAA